MKVLNRQPVIGYRDTELQKTMSDVFCSSVVLHGSFTLTSLYHWLCKCISHSKVSFNDRKWNELLPKANAFVRNRFYLHCLTAHSAKPSKTRNALMNKKKESSVKTQLIVFLISTILHRSFSFYRVILTLWRRLLLSIFFNLQFCSITGWSILLHNISFFFSLL